MRAISSREVVQALVQSQTKHYTMSHAIDIAVSAQMGKAFLAKPKFLPVRMYKGQVDLPLVNPRTNHHHHLHTVGKQANVTGPVANDQRKKKRLGRQQRASRGENTSTKTEPGACSHQGQTRPMRATMDQSGN